MSFRYKYLKYKKKYLNLKIRGGFNYYMIFKKAFENNKRVELNKKTIDGFNKKKYASTYGELTQEAFNDLMEKTKKILNINHEPVLKNLNFADLGSGLGKVTLMAFNNGAEEAVGIEYSPERHDKAIEMYNKLESKIQQGDIDRFTKVRYINGDILNNKILNSFLENTHVVYISNLCFSVDLNNQIAKVLKLLPTNAIVFCSKKIDATHLKHHSIIKVKQSWGINQSINVYQII